MNARPVSAAISTFVGTSCDQPKIAGFIRAAHDAETRDKTPRSSDSEDVDGLEKIIPWQNRGNGQLKKLRQTDAAGALASAEGFVRRSSRSRASCAGYSRSPVSELLWQYEGIIRWASKVNRLIRPEFTQALLIAADDQISIGGVEHETFNEVTSRRWVKFTRPGKAGVELCAKVDQAGVRGSVITAEASLIGYLRRLILANDLLGDDIYLHGVIDDPSGARLVTSQRDVDGVPATPEQIAKHFATHGFREINEKTFYHAEENLLISDAHSANVFMTAQGVAVPFDVCVQQPSGDLLRAIEPCVSLDFDGDWDAPNRLFPLPMHN